MRLLAIDPGPEQSAWVLYDPVTRQPLAWDKQPNHDVRGVIDDTPATRLAVESVASYGMAVGADVFETCVWSGRFLERWLFFDAHKRFNPIRVYRRDVKLHLCGSQRAKDANVRQALIDRYGPGKEKAIGRKATPGPLYGLTGDCWAALGVAATASETRLEELAA